MKPRARRARAILRRRSRITRGMARRRRAGLWDDVRPILGPLTGYDLYMISWLRGNGPLLDPGKMQSVFLDSI